MIKKIEDLNFYELLEVSPQANAQEIHKAYERIRRVYDPNSVALYSLFTSEETAAIHQRIEEAYRTLVYEDNRKKYDAMLRNRNELPEIPSPPPPAPKFQPRPFQASPPAYQENQHTGSGPGAMPQATPQPGQEGVSPVPSFVAEFTGPVIKLLREQMGLSIRNIAEMTKVSVRYLELIEEENFKKLPARAYIRGFLMLYAKALGYDPDRMSSDYLKRYDAATGFPYSLRKKPQV
ncbi:MAG TPA: helix-turn-helix domain-containing protein [Nitrospirota bacterium]|nr:helix-turn-helix domain-containing protein [Nitrospirota bacterium]